MVSFKKKQQLAAVGGEKVIGKYFTRYSSEPDPGDSKNPESWIGGSSHTGLK